MLGTAAGLASMEVSRMIKAPRAKLYAACLNPDLLASWRVPDGMTGRIDDFDGREGGSYSMSLIYRDPAQGPGGKTSPDTDSFTGRFVTLVPNEKIVEQVAFESDDPAFGGTMTITTTLADMPNLPDDALDRTEITMAFEGLPAGIRPEDNEEGTRQSLRKLAALLE